MVTGTLAAVLLAAGLPRPAAAQDVAVPWALLGVGPGGKSLVVETVASSSCVRRATATVKETRRAIKITMRRSTEGPPPGRFCALVVRYDTHRVRLRRAVGGRRITGGARRKPSRGAGFEHTGTTTFRVIPAVIGLRFGEARRVLEDQAFEVRRAGKARRGPVVAQSPAAGKRIAVGGQRGGPPPRIAVKIRARAPRS